MLWKDKIALWKSGVYQTYPDSIKNRFFYETFVCDKNMKNKYKEKFIENKQLENIKNEDYSSFISYINKSKSDPHNKYVTSFTNLSGDSILIIPIPKNNKNYTTMKDFCDNASITQQKIFWKRVANEIEIILNRNDNDKIYVSTHGLGEHYFHLRLDKKPKYYKTTEFIV